MFQRNQLITLAGTSALKIGVMVGIASSIVWFSATRISAIVTSIVQMRTVSTLSERRSTTVTQLRSDLKEFEPTLTALRTPLIRPENSLEFLSLLESIAAQTSMTQSVRFGIPVALSNPNVLIPVGTVDFTIELAGTSSTLARYVSLLESAHYYTQMNSISMNSSSEQGLDGLSHILLTGNLYVSQE